MGRSATRPPSTTTSINIDTVRFNTIKARVESKQFKNASEYYRQSIETFEATLPPVPRSE